jgi:hypothetical protein
MLLATMADELREQGCTQSHATDVFAECYDLWLACASVARQFAAGPKVANARYEFAAGHKRQVLFKQFLVKYQDKQAFTPEHPLYRLGQEPGLIDLASEAVGCEVGLYSADLWYVMPGMGHTREWSQNWHRDPEGQKVIKVFAFIEDVTEDAGPLEYVAESFVGGAKYQDVGRAASYGDQTEVENISATDKRRFVCPSGTVVAANTSGLHRGGYCRSTPRINTVWTYLPVGFTPLYTLKPSC